MRLLFDMNLSPDWVPVFMGRGIACVHWSTVGDPRSSDAVILEWAREHHYWIVTHDLDFGAILAASGSQAPSVLQLRTEDVSAQSCAELVFEAIREHESLLEIGALISIDPASRRVRILPLR